MTTFACIYLSIGMLVALANREVEKMVPVPPYVIAAIVMIFWLPIVIAGLIEKIAEMRRVGWTKYWEEQLKDLEEDE